jgi:hypothetical protein
MLTPPQFADIPPSDGEVLRRIFNALYWDLAVPSDYLSVKVENGWVTISGDVATPARRVAPRRTFVGSPASGA